MEVGVILITLVWVKSEVFSFLALSASSHLLFANVAFESSPGLCCLAGILISNVLPQWL